MTSWPTSELTAPRSLLSPDLDLKTLYSGIGQDTPEYRALSLMASGWPWSREIYGLVSERLLSAGARAVIFDVLIPKPGVGDEAFQAVLRRFPDRIVVGANFVEETIGPGQQAWALTLPSSTVVPDPVPDHPSIGYVTLWPGFNGVIRSAQYRASMEQFHGGVPRNEEAERTAPSSLAFRGASKFGAPKLDQPFQLHLIRYSGPPGTFTAIPVFQLFVPDYWKGNLGDGAIFRDRVVLVGLHGNWSQDAHSTPFGIMPGPEIHLNMLNALLHNAFLHELPSWTGDLLIALAVIAAWLLTVLVKKTWLRLGAFVLLAAAYLYSVKLAHDQADAIMLAIPPVLAFAVAGLVSFVYDFTHETLEKLRIRRTLEAYVSKDVVREVLDNPETYLSKLGGQRESVALIVTDLRGFTTMSEEMDFDPARGPTERIPLAHGRRHFLPPRLGR